MFLDHFSSTDALFFLLAFLRTTALILTLPKLGQGGYLLFSRILISGAICLVTTPLFLKESTLVPQADLFSLAINEIIVGLSLGLSASCVVLGLQSAGQIVSQFLGLQYGMLQQGQTPDSTTDYRKMFYVAAVISWFAAGGHRMAINGLLQSYTLLPIGTESIAEPFWEWFNQLVTACLGFAIRFSLPVGLVGIVGLMVAGFSAKILGSGQTTQFGIGLNQLFALILLPAMFLFFYHEIKSGTFNHLESLFQTISNPR